MSRGDHSLQTFASAFRRAVTAEDAEARLAAADAAVAALGALLGRGRAKGRGGRRPVHDRSWAESQLIAMAIDPDGVGDCQSDIAERLQLRFEAAGKRAPGRSWVQEVVGQFLQRSRVHETEAHERFLRTAELSSAFGTAENYAKFCAWRMRIEERWLSEKDLQRRYQTPADYVAEMIERTPWARSENLAELADVAG